jgi:hypothetical protein
MNYHRRRTEPRIPLRLLDNFAVLYGVTITGLVLRCVQVIQLVLGHAPTSFLYPTGSGVHHLFDPEH